MLINLRTIHKPESLEEAAELLKRPGVYPLYGAGASLVRSGSNDIEEAVDLSMLVAGENAVDDSGDLYLSPASTLEQIASDLDQVDSATGGGLSNIIKSEVPETLRNVLTLGDLFMEHDPASLILTLMSGLHTDINGYDGRTRDHVTMRIRDWFGVGDDQRRQLIFRNVECRRYAQLRYAYDKVSRTPSDAPIVGVVAFYDPENAIQNAFTFVGGLTDHPAHYISRMQSTIADYKGSAEYRTEMARVLSERAVARVIELAKPK